MTGDPEVSLIILSWNTRDLLRACLRSLCDQDHGVVFETIVIDNASEDDSADVVAREFPGVTLVRNEENRGYAGGNNQGMRCASAPLWLLLNSDTEVQPGALRLLVDFLRDHPEHGAVAPRLSNPDGTVQRACMRFPTLWDGFLYDSIWERWFGRPKRVRRYFMEEFDHLHSVDVDQPPGAAFLWRREVAQSVGLFDESLWLFFNDVDLCRRVAGAGHRIHYLAEAEILHHGGQSTSRFPQFVLTWNVNRLRYYAKHFGWRGRWVIKWAVFQRAVEEMIKAVWRGPRGARRATLGAIASVVRATWAEPSVAPQEGRV